MIEEWIKEGDLVIVDKSLQAKVNDIIIAVVDWEFTDLNMGLRKLNILLRGKDFKIDSDFIMFKHPVSDRKILINSISILFDKIFNENILYRSTWVNFQNLKNQDSKQMDLLNYKEHEKNSKLSKVVNKLNFKFWRFTVLSAASLIKKKSMRIDDVIGEVI